MSFFRSLTRSADFPPISLDDWAQMFSFNGNAYGIGNGLTTTLSGDHESVEASFAGYVQAGYKQNGVVFACMLVRLLLFSEARFQFQQLRNGRPGDLFGTAELGILENPWPNGTTGDLMTRAIQDADLAGNFYAYRESKTRLRRMRPDWVSIVLGSMSDPDVQAGDLDAEAIGYIYHPGGHGSGRPPVALLREQVAHFAPIPDPIATFRGMSWLTPILRELMADGAATSHKLKFFENAATSNMVVSLNPEIKLEAFEAFVEKMDEQHRGAVNAYKTLYLAGGADAKVVGSNFQQIDFKVTQGAGETRIAAAAGVPPIIVGLSEGLAASSYSNYAQARRRFSDGTMRPLWRMMADSMAPIVNVPSGARLTYDDRDIAFLQEDQKDLADIQVIESTAIHLLIAAGYEPDSVIKAVSGNDLTLLTHTGLFSVQLQPAGKVAQGKGATVQGVVVPAGKGKNALREAMGEDSRLVKLLDESEGNPYLRELLAPLLNGDGG